MIESGYSKGGQKINQVKRMKDIECENTRLKKAGADLALDKVILKKALEGNFQAPKDAVGVASICSASCGYPRGFSASNYFNCTDL